MENKIKVLLADNSEAFGIPCAAAMRSHSLDAVSYTHLDVYKRQLGYSPYLRI